MRIPAYIFLLLIPSKNYCLSDQVTHLTFSKTTNTMQSNRRFDKTVLGGKRGCQRSAASAVRQTLVRRPEATHKVCHIAGEGRGLTAPRAATRKTGVWEAPPPSEARARQPPKQEKPRLLRAPPPPPCTRAH